MHGTADQQPFSIRRAGTQLAAAALIGITALGAVAPASAAEKVILILDSSGSMAGKIKGVRKIDIARAAVDNLVSTMQPGTELGVMAYGHRRKDDCSDIQTLAVVGQPNRQNIMRSVNALRPIGKTPLGQSVLRAAKKLNFTEEKATVILVSDGKENCGVDPCQLGRALAGQGIDFKTHVIGFNLRRGEEKGLRCLAENTGGMYVPARDPQSLQKALTVTVKQASFHRWLVQLHKAKGSTWFKVYATALAIVLFLLVASGLIMGLQVKSMRRLTAISSIAGLGAFVGFVALG